MDLGPITLDTAKRVVTRDGTALDLTPGEYSVLECLAMNRGRVISKERLQESINDSDSYTNTNVVEVLVCNLRKKIGPDSGKKVVKTRRGHGYFID